MVGLVHAKIMDCRTCACWTNPLSDLCPPDYWVDAPVHPGILGCRTYAHRANRLSDWCTPD